MAESLQAIYVVEMRISPASVAADLFYVLLQYGEGRSSDTTVKPLIEEDYLVAFARRDDMSSALDRSDGTTDSSVERHSIVIDYANALYLVYHGNVDEDADILNTLNVLSDLFEGINFAVSSTYKSTLNDLVRYLTFDNVLDAYFENRQGSREVCYDGLLWCLGALISSSIIRF